MKDVAAALAGSDPHEVVADLDAHGRAELDLGGEVVAVTADELDVRVEGRHGFSLAQDGPYGVALDVEITPELAAEGMARELVRAIQELRKSSGLEVDDRIALWLNGPPELLDKLQPHTGFVSSEVLSVELITGSKPPDDAASTQVELEGGAVTAALRRARG